MDIERHVLYYIGIKVLFSNWFSGFQGRLMLYSLALKAVSGSGLRDVLPTAKGGLSGIDESPKKIRSRGARTDL